MSNELILGISILAILLSLITLAISIKTLLLHKKVFGNIKNNGEIISTLESFHKETKIALLEYNELKNTLQSLEISNKKNFSIISIRKFNPYEESGGDLSFCIVFLNREKNGFMITSLHGRERTRIYTRTISDGNINVEILFDEKETLKEAVDKANQ
jgi:hypothetical protein